MKDQVRRLEVSELDIARARASVRPLSQAVAAAKRDAGAGAVVLAWIGDMHIHAPEEYRGVDNMYTRYINTEANFELAIAEVRALSPAADVVVLGGDLSDWNTPEEYAQFRRILDRCWPAEEAPPILPIRGNHDHLTDKPSTLPFHEVWPSIRRPSWPNPADPGDGLYYETRACGWRFVALDPGHGAFTDTQRLWAQRVLAPQGDDLPTVVLCHIPIVAVGNWVDRGSLTDGIVVTAIDQSPDVKLVLSGHTHKSAAWRYRRKIHAVLPGCAFGIGEPCGWGCVVLGEHMVHAVFIKELAGPTFEHVAWELADRPGAYRRLSTPLFENSPLLHPGLLPRHEDQAERE